MKAMILAAGRGERMRPLTDVTPKPLLPIAGKPIIEHTIEQLVADGFTDIVINYAYLGEQIKDYCGDGARWGATIRYSAEGKKGLETAGGIIKALPLLEDAVFLVVNGDIATNFPYRTLRHQPIDLAHLVLIDNPVHHPQGDFALTADGKIVNHGAEKLTFSGIGIYHPSLFQQIRSGADMNKLGAVLRHAVSEQRISGEKFSGFWLDIGTPERLIEANEQLLAMTVAK